MNELPDPVLTSEIAPFLDFNSILRLSTTCKRFNHILLKQTDEARLVKKILFLSPKEFNQIGSQLYSYQKFPSIKFRLQPVFSTFCIYMFQRGNQKGAMCGKSTDFEPGNYCKVCSRKRTISGRPPETLDTSPVFLRYTGTPPGTNLLTGKPKKCRPEFMYYDGNVYNFNSVSQLGKVVGQYIEIFGFKYIYTMEPVPQPQQPQDQVYITDL